MVIRFDAVATLRVLAIAGLALTAGLAAPLSRACVTCDTSNKCHSGDEQGGYLCRTSEVQCGLLAQIFGVQCRAATCETLIVCDNRAPQKDRPEAAVSTAGAQCPPSVPAEPPPPEPETSADSE